MMERVLGLLPQHMLKRVECVPLFLSFQCTILSMFLFKYSCYFYPFNLLFYQFVCVLLIVRTAKLMRSMLEEVDWTGQRVQHLGKALKLFWSYLVSRCVWECVIFKLRRSFGSRGLFRGSLLIASLCASYSFNFMGYYHLAPKFSSLQACAHHTQFIFYGILSFTT